MGDMNFSLTTFNKTGKLLQIEYALNRVNQGKLSLGIKARNGVVIATDKKVNSVLVDDSEFQKIQHITPNTGFIYSGMGPDYRVLVRAARKEAQAYYLTYREIQPVNQIVKASALVMQEYTQSGGVRPFGTSLLVAGFDAVNGPQLYQVDPSGAAYPWIATAIGTNSTNAKSFLERRVPTTSSEELELEDAIHIALLTLREGYEGEMTSTNIEVGVVNPQGVFRILSAEEVKDYLEETN